MLAAGLYDYLKSNAAVKALVEDRIYPLRVPQRAAQRDTYMPCLVYQKVGATRSATFCATDNLVMSSYQIDSYAIKYLDAVELAETAAAALVDYTGAMGDTHVDRVFLEAELELNDVEPGLYRVSQTYIIWHKQE